MTRIRVLTAVAATALLAACASGGGTAGDTSAAPRYDRNRISTAEVQEALAQNVMNVYALISTRRPQWLTLLTAPSAMSTRVGVTVWMDRARVGTVEALRSISLAGVNSVRFLPPSEAQSELGLDNVSGAIVINTATVR